MKSAYELAMERLNRAAPSAHLSTGQKAQLAELDSLYRSKIAEREIVLQGAISEAHASGNPAEAARLTEELSRTRRQLADELEARKSEVRQSSRS